MQRRLSSKFTLDAFFLVVESQKTKTLTENLATVALANVAIELGFFNG